MTRLTVTLPADLHRALKLAAARRGQTIGEIVAESLRHYGIKTERQAAEIVAEARQRSGLTEPEAIELATSETRAARRR